MSGVKLVHLIGSLDPNMGGLPRAVVALAGAQVIAGNAVTVVHCGETPSEEVLLRWTGGAEALRKLSFRSLPRIWTLGRSLKLEAELQELEPDWVQTHGLWEPILHAGMRWAERHQTAYGITPHSMGHPWKQKNCRIRKALIRIVLGVENLWKNSSLLHALTEAEATDWRPICGDRVEVIANGIRIPSVVGEPSVDIPSRPYILFLSRLDLQKAPLVLMRAFVALSARVPEVDLVFVGPDYGEQRNLEKMIHHTGLKDRVWVAGVLEGPDKWEILKRCTLFCLPSQAEGHSLAVLEACAMGKPCLITEECGFPELIEEGGAQLIHRNPAALANRLYLLLQDPQGLAEMGVKAKALVEEHYTWERSAEGFQQVVARRLSL